MKEYQDENSKMRLSWWLGRFKRVTPLVVILVIGFALWQFQKTGNNEARHPKDRDTLPTFSFTPPPTVPPPSQWLIVNAAKSERDPCNMLAATFTGWTILLVNTKQNSGTSHSSCRYLDENKARSLLSRYALVANGALMAGFLFAIENHAKVLYSPPPGSDLEKLEMLALPDDHHQNWLTASSSTIFPSEHHFGCNISLLYSTKPLTSPIKYHLCKSSTPSIAAPVRINSKPLVLKHPSTGEETTLGQTCDKTATSVVLENGIYADVSLSGARLQYSAFWALSHCLSNNMDEADCQLWNVIVQSFLWKSGSKMLVFNDPTLKYNRKGNSVNSNSLMKFLEEWTCPLKSTMACGINLLDQLSTMKIISQDFAKKQIAWFKALNAIDYDYPELQATVPLTTCLKSNEIQFKPVNFSDSLPWRKARTLPFTPILNQKINTKFYENQCKSIASTMPESIQVNFSSPWMQMDDILLIIIFNTPHFENIPYLELMYRCIFPSILYCGPLPLDENEFPWAADYSLSFATYNNYLNHTPGAFNYECMIKAIEMNYKVSGYLVISDDMFVLPQSMPKFDKNIMWFIPPKEVRTGEIRTLRECRLGMCDFHPHWHWWEDYQKSTMEAFKALQKHKHSDVFYKCYKQLVMINGAEMRPNGAYSDIYYIPVKRQHQVLELFQHFRDHKVFVEITVPTVINCLEGIDNVVPLPGKQIWDESRDMPWKYFTNSDLLGKKYFHPTKWSYITDGIVEFKHFFCNDVIPYLFDPYERIKKQKV